MGKVVPLDVVREIDRFNAGRDEQRLALKFARMRADAFAFLRGTNHLFCERLSRAGPLPKAPPAWACGDLHLENFGTYKGDNRLVYFDIVDFDDAALAPAVWDIARMLTSIRVGADAMHAGAQDASALAAHFVEAYGAALAAGKALRIERETSDGLVRTLFESLAARDRRTFLESRTLLHGKRRMLRIDGRRTLPLTDAAERAHVAALVEAEGAHAAEPRFYDVLDVARRIAGTGSLGLARYVVLVRGKGSPDRNYLLDLKQAQASALPASLRQPKWLSQAHRVVAAQQRMQAVSMAFLHPVESGQASYVLRALQPSEDRLELDRSQQSLAQLGGVVATMGRALAWAQLRSSGRQGSAIADDLIAWAPKRRWRRRVLALSEALADQTRADWKVYATAYDAGAFGPSL